MKKIFLILSICLILCGCLTYQKYSFKFDFKTRRVEKTYYNIQSREGFDEKNYSIEQDWEMLKSGVGEEFGKEFDPDVIKPIKAELFQDGKVLSGKEIFEVQLPKAFPSKKIILKKLNSNQYGKLEFQTINNEIFLFARKTKIESSNGKIIKTDKNNMVVWPEEQALFEFTLIEEYEEYGGGKSLLPFYLKEKGIEDKKG